MQIVTVALGRVNGLLRFADDSPMPTRIWHSWPLDGRRGSCFQKNMAFIWGYPGSWLGIMASLRTPLKSKAIYCRCHGFYSHANNHQNVWLQSTRAWFVSRRFVLQVMWWIHREQTKHRNQASTPLGSVITPHNQPCQYHEHNIEGHCYPKVVTLT